MMRRDSTPFWILIPLGVVVALLAPGSVAAQQERAVLSGVQYLKGHAGAPAGQSAMIALALMKAEVPHSDPVVQACLAKVRSRFTTSSYEPELGDGPGTYEAAAAVMALSTEDAAENRGYLGIIAAYLIGRQNGNGSWDYRTRTAGDTSISQYAVLGLWEAENAGVDVPPSVWDRAAGWYMSVQSGPGSWNYHRDEPQNAETCAMTAAGVGSLLICQRQLDRHRQARRGTSTLLSSLVTEGQQADYRPSTSNSQLDQAIKRGMSWLGANFAPANAAVTGQTPYYMLYGVERIGALADRQTLGRVDWYAKGRDFVLSTQHADGSWHSMHGVEMNTVWAILFLTKSTAKTIRRIEIKRLGAGTLLGGRELPKDLSSMTVAGGRVVSRPMNGAIEGMLAVLEDPRAEQADAAVAGMVERYYREGPDALRPFKSRFRKMLSDRDPGVQKVGAWALAHIGDLAVAPLLIDVLATPNQDEEVVSAARLGLQLLSRKIDGLGPPSPSTPDERQAAARKWREWYEAIRPLDLDDQDEGTSSATESRAPVPAPSPSRSSQR
ncbi:MAG: hypothetical protein ACHRXM_25310 [Isosphaerales bacterium]